ncbi:SDR family NAD(P)-dependent oxidoreductase [Plebeiibacterium sediminum]|uniref:SDR family NAD(P)-dependent oxidoreductase n=1 Tax=Plebeiibacterium sediminum TaxID=2992112 RepID=A0AAE3M6L0_9BACT|nr:SDR family NAD(P)-dependent oxidoreductase [Plebeiobacterium sediminum]MCW3788246.1 SDR family NAD(P)-dependent oxidoreductase [Plebeiobacterium sediminum]
MSRIFITGSSDGLGLLTAKKLISQGHQVVLHARNNERAKDAMQQAPGAEAVVVGDLSVISEIKQLAIQVNMLGKFNAIIHNAGILHVPEKAQSKDGLPLLFAVNTLAPYMLTALIDRPERLIYLSSSMHRQGDAGEFMLESIAQGKAFPSYSDTKLYDLILALAFSRKWPDIVVNAVDPGWVPTKMGGAGARDNLDKGYETQAWLAVSVEAKALHSSRLLFHKQEVDSKQQAAQVEIQDKLLKVCEEISHVSL